MNDLTGMFEDSADLEERIGYASQLLKQAADETGVDLDSLSEEDLSGMLTELVTEGAGEGGGHGGEGGQEGGGGGEGGEGGGGGEEGKTASEITVADVALEITKRAAAQGVDLSEVDPDVYGEIFDKVASEMADPEFAEEQQKWAAQAANMDELGRVAARGFVDEINKLAADKDDDDKKDKDEDDDDEVDIKVKKAALKEKAKALAAGARAVGGRAGNSLGRAERRISESVGRGTSKNKTQNFEAMQNRGRKVIGGAAGASVATGAAAHHRSKKAGLEDAALVADAIEVLRAAGYDL
jgi:hypothetical protein